LTRHNDGLAGNSGQSLRDRATEFDSFSIAIDESADVSRTARLAGLMRGFDAEFSLTRNAWYSTSEGDYYWRVYL
jgi:hypothetical protein